MSHLSITPLKNYFSSGATRSYSFRQEKLASLKKAIEQHKDAIINALHTDLKKPRFESVEGEINIILHEIQFAQKYLRTWMQEKKLRTPWRLFPATSAILPEPYGVVFIMAPWNYPFQLAFLPLIGAIAAGNCAVIKPSEYAPASEQLIIQIINATFDPSYIVAISCDAECAANQTAQSFDYIFFTGSPAIGKKVMAAAAQNLTPLTLELGGKSPCIITESASIACAAKRVAWAKFFNAGQNCIAPDYILVQRTVKKDFISALIKEISTMFGNDPQQSADYGRIINDKHVTRLMHLMQNGTIVHGGTHDAKDRYIAPTVLENPDQNSPLMQEEIFGPLLPIIEYDSFENAISFINAKPHPLIIYLFDANKQRKQQLINQTQSGSVSINDLLIHMLNPNLPFGGIGHSGFGAYHGKKSFDTFSHYKSLFYGSCRFDRSIRYAPHKK